MAISEPQISPYRQVGALFTNPDDAERAVKDLLAEGFSRNDIFVSTQQYLKDVPEVRQQALREGGYVEEDVLYFDKELAEGKTLVSVSHVRDEQCGAVIHILNKNGSHYDPDGTRNVRDDVVGMTTGAVIGAAMGALLGGPIGAAVGEVGGGIIGGALGTVKEESE